MSPARIQRGRRLAEPGVGDRPLGDELAGQALGVLRESGTPGEAPAVVGNLAKAELEERRKAARPSQPHAVRLSFTPVVVAEDDLEARVDPLRMGREEVAEPTLYF